MTIHNQSSKVPGTAVYPIDLMYQRFMSFIDAVSQLASRLAA